MCKECVTFAHLMRRWRVSADLLNALIRSQRLETHEHGERTTITKASVQECQWQIAVAKASMEEAT